MAAVLDDRGDSPFMSVRQVAAYLQLNEKKVYALLKEGKIPGTKVTGKWLFPRELIDRWVLESSHGGVLSDRLVVTGSDDPLLYRLILGHAQHTRARALVSYSPTGTRLGLELLQAHRADACALHWGPDSESHLRHPALLSQYPQHRGWILVRAWRRRQGLLLAPRLGLADAPLPAVLARARAEGLRWRLRQPGAGAQRFLQDALQRLDPALAALPDGPSALSEREAAAAIAMGEADLAPGCQAIATEFGLHFTPLGWEAFDLVLPRRVYFRQLFQDLLGRLRGAPARALAQTLGGYDLAPSGALVWSAE